MSKKFSPFRQKMLQGYRNCILRVYRNSLNEKNSWKNVLSFFFFGHWAKKFWLFVIFLRWSCQKCILRVQGNTLTKKKFFRKSSLRFQFFFGLWLGKIRFSGKVFSAGLKKSAFYVSIDRFWGEHFKKSFPRHFWTTSINFPVVGTVFYMSRRTI